MFGLFDDTIYEGSLPDLVAASVKQDAVDDFVDQALDGNEIEDLEAEATPYIEKLLSEEVEKQFEDPKRPFIELVLNAIDARPEDAEDYHVRVRTKHDGFVVADEGESMGIEDMLENFLLPFSSEKDAYEDIGRFGVGFYSNLQYVLDRNDATMVVKTNNGEEAYTAEFWSDTGDVEDLEVRISEGGRWKQGTKIALHGADIGSYDLDTYLDNYLSYFDEERARVTNWWRQVNDEPDGTTYRDTVELPVDDSTVEQTIRMTLDTATEDGDGVNLYSQGVLIDDAPFDQGSLHMSVPSAVGLVEGRNGFKSGEALDATIDGFYDMLTDAAADHDAETMREMIPELERLTDQDMDDTKREDLVETLFDDQEYIMTSQEATSGRKSEYRRAKRFFGDTIDDNVYPAADRGTVEYWDDELATFDDLVDDRTEELASGDIADLVAYADKHSMDLDGLEAMQANETKTYKSYSLVEVDGDGVSPFIPHGGSIYINVDHPAIQDDTGSGRYGRFVDVNRADHESEDRIERKVMWQ